MKLKGLLKVALVLLAVSSLFVACDTIAGGKWPRVEKVYMKPSEDWADGRFAVWFWETGKEGSFTDMKASTEYEGLYEVNVPAGVDNVIFVKMSADSKENKWDNKEAQTDDLQVPILGDGGAVYSITAKTWIELGAKEPEPEPEPEPEKPEPDAGIELSKITHIVGIGGDWANHIKLTNNTFTFYASKTKEEFVFTSGKFEDNVSYKAFGATVEEFGKEYAIITGLCGGKNQTNIVINGLTKGAEYKISLKTGTDGKIYIKVEATGNTQTGPVIDINEIVYVKSNHGDAELVKDGNIASATISIKATSAWGGCDATELQFGIVKDNNWSVKYTGATITELNKKFDLVKGDASNNKYSGVKAYEEYKITVDCLDGTVKLEKTKEAPTVITYVEKVYVKVEEDDDHNDWLDADAWIIAFFWGNGDQWVKHPPENSGVYEFEVPTGSTGFKFVRMNPSESEGSWDSGKMWAQTGDLSIPLSTDQNVVYTIKGWDSGSYWTTL